MTGTEIVERSAARQVARDPALLAQGVECVADRDQLFG